MKISDRLFYGGLSILSGIALIVFTFVLMGLEIKELRKDVNRVSVIQVRCAGHADYGQCVEREMNRIIGKS